MSQPASQPAISQPVVALGPKSYTLYYELTVGYSKIRLHNEWINGVDVLGAMPDCPSMWYGTDLEALNQPPAIIEQLATLWASLFAAQPYEPSYNRSIAYDRITHDYAMTINGEYVGSAPSYSAAEAELDRLCYNLAKAEAQARLQRLSDDYKALKALAKQVLADGQEIMAAGLDFLAGQKKAEGLALQRHLAQGE